MTFPPLRTRIGNRELGYGKGGLPRLVIEKGTVVFTPYQAAQDVDYFRSRDRAVRGIPEV